MPKYIQIVAPVSAGLILDGSITTAKLASTLDLSGKTITYRSIVNADISATAAIALTKLASNPIPRLQRASGTVSVGVTEVDIVTITPTRLPAKFHLIAYECPASAHACTMRITNEADVTVTLGSVFAMAQNPTSYYQSMSLTQVGTWDGAAVSGQYAEYVYQGISLAATTIKLKAVRAAGATAANVCADIVVIS